MFVEGARVRTFVWRVAAAAIRRSILVNQLQVDGVRFLNNMFPSKEGTGGRTARVCMKLCFT